MAPTSPSPSIRLRNLKLIFLMILVFALFCVFCKLFFLNVTFTGNKNIADFKRYHLPPWASQQIIRKYKIIIHKNGSSTSACRIPKLEPFHSSIMHLANEELPPLICTNDRFPLLFNSTIEPSSRLIPVMDSEIRETIKFCCIRKVTRVQNSDQLVNFSEECRPLSLETETLVPEGWIFVAIYCEFQCTTAYCIFTNSLVYKVMDELSVDKKVVVDLHTFFHDKPAVLTKNNSEMEGPPPKLNVMVLVLDAVSRMNFLRVFPEVHWFLTKNLSAVEMEGYHKVGENTFPNIVPLLRNGADVNDCAKYGSIVDNCPFIWKDYKTLGYHTLFAEDGMGMNIFDLKGFYFQNRPTDHYFRPFTIVSSQLLSHEMRSLSNMCFGPRTAFQTMMDYMEKMAVSKAWSRQPFFQFAMSGSVTHEFLNGGRFIAKDLLASLQRLHRKGIFNNTVLILMSDHGSRIDAMRQYPQGFLEDRLPCLYIALPQWFQAKYSTAYGNLKENAKRLTTSWDIYQTLKDLLHPNKNFQEATLNQREEKDYAKNFTGGISLFRPISLSRTCKMAKIPEQFCSCNMEITPVPSNTSFVISGAKHGVSHINTKLMSYSSCAQLKLKRILHAEQVNIDKLNQTVAGGISYKRMYRIVFETSPGAARFESLLTVIIPTGNVTWERRRTIEVGSGLINAKGTVSRVNLFEEQSWCVDDYDIKPFCYCN